MSLLIIDQKKCKQDGLCAADCPMGIIRFKGNGSYPELPPESEPMCIRCGHCVAVCPHGALDHTEVPLAACTTIDKALVVSSAQADQFLRSRRSVRQFKKKPVEKATLQRLIETARYAPTASNTQLVEWLVIDDPQRLHAIAAQAIDWMRALLQDPKAPKMPYYPVLVKAWDAGVDSVLRSAPCLVTAMAPGPAPIRMIDLTLALSYLELAAPQYGLGTCWAGLLQGAMLANPSLKQAVGIPHDYPFHFPLMIGYSKVRYFRLPERQPPKIHWR
jgi:nitroreductase/NAD-dependent dihydropyrimidine dehydrogenase PreA subunit